MVICDGRIRGEDIMEEDNIYIYIYQSTHVNLFDLLHLFNFLSHAPCAAKYIYEHRSSSSMHLLDPMAVV